MRQPNIKAIQATVRQVQQHRATLSTNKSAPPDATVESASRRTGRTDVGRTNGGR